MQIIKRGKLPERDYVFRGTCISCGSVVQFAASEAKYTPGCQREPEPFWQLPCPVCEIPYRVITVHKADRVETFENWMG